MNVEVMRDMMRRLKDLERITAKIPSRVKPGGGSGGTALGIRTVEYLPSLPTETWDVVYWTSDGAGTGDNQWWGAGPDSTEWAPMFDVSNLSGVPV